MFRKKSFEIDNDTTTYNNKCRLREIYCLRRHSVPCKNVQMSSKSGLYEAILFGNDEVLLPNHKCLWVICQCLTAKLSGH